MDEISGSAPHPLDTAIVAFWLKSLQMEAAQANVKLVNLRESQLHVPSVAADYDADRTTGRIAVWITGEFDFEVLHRSNGEFAFFRHESTVELTDPKLMEAYKAFLEGMANPAGKPD